MIFVRIIKAITGGGGGGISDAPSDGSKYARKDAGWVVVNDSYIDGEVATHADLPVTLGDPPINSAYLVREASGLWLISRKPAGVYIRTANAGALTDWTHAGAFPDVFSDANFMVYDDGDTSKLLKISLGGATAGKLVTLASAHTDDRTITLPDASGTLQLNRAALTNLEAAEADVASSTTCDIGSAASDNVRITGTTTITGLGTVTAGTRRYVRFEGALTLTHNGTSLILPGGANITTAANDRMIAVSLGSGNWLVVSYTKADGTAVVLRGSRTLVTFEANDLQPPASNYHVFDTRTILAASFRDTTADDSALLVKRMPEGANLASGVTTYMEWVVAGTATSGNVIWQIEFARLNAGNQDLDSITFDTATVASASAANGTAGKITKVSISIAAADLDGITEGDLFIMRITRLQSNGSDTLADKAVILGGEIRSAA